MKHNLFTFYFHNRFTFYVLSILLTFAFAAGQWRDNKRAGQGSMCVTRPPLPPLHLRLFVLHVV